MPDVLAYLGREGVATRFMSEEGFGSVDKYGTNRAGIVTGDGSGSGSRQTQLCQGESGYPRTSNEPRGHGQNRHLSAAVEAGAPQQ